MNWMFYERYRDILAFIHVLISALVSRNSLDGYPRIVQQKMESFVGENIFAVNFQSFLIFCTVFMTAFFLWGEKKTVNTFWYQGQRFSYWVKNAPNDFVKEEQRR